MLFKKRGASAFLGPAELNGAAKASEFIYGSRLRQECRPAIRGR
jgi:hypothetical protein